MFIVYGKVVNMLPLKKKSEFDIEIYYNLIALFTEKPH